MPKTDRKLPNFSTQDCQDVVRSFGADLERGLTAQEVARRLAEDGDNVMLSKPAVAKWRKVLAQFTDPLIFLLLAAVVVSLVAWLFEGASGVPVDAVVIAAIVLANALLGFAQQTRAENAVAALQVMTEVTSAVIRDGKNIRVPSANLVRGDTLVLGEGDSVGADARLVHAAALRVAESSLTGESEAVNKDAEILVGDRPLGDRTNMVFKGTAVTQGTGRAVVTGTGMDSELGAIARMLDTTVQDPTPLQNEMAYVGKILGLAVMAIAAIVMTTVWLMSEVQTLSDAVTVLLLGVSLAVAAVPEGLPAILSVLLSIGVQRMASRHAIVKKLSSVETLGSASVICSDKTGTLTRNEMTVQRIVTASGTSQVTGVGYTPHGRVQDGGSDVDNPDMKLENILVISGGSLASNADLQEVDGEWHIVGDPTEAAFLVAERKLGVSERRKQRFTRIGEVPFTSSRKIMSTVELDHKDGNRPVLVTKGAPDVLLKRCTQLQIGTKTVPLDQKMRSQILSGVEIMASEALRTISVAYRQLDAQTVAAESTGGPQGGALSAEFAAGLEHDLVFVGTVGLIDPPRHEAAIAVDAAHRAGIRVLMITGDHPATALRIAQELGIAAPGAAALSGREIDQLDDAGLRKTVRATSVYARVAPEHKLRIVDALQADHNVVAMTGDGVNDAPALKSADIGVAMGITGTEVTKEAAAMILVDDNFSTIVAAVRQGRIIFDNIKKFLRYLLSSNMGEVLSVFGGVVLAGVIGLREASNEAVVLPLLATQLLWINLVTDSAPALALGVDRETDDVMARAPRRTSDRVIDRRMWRGVMLIATVTAAATLITIDIFLPGGLIEGTDSLKVARTAGFTTLVLAQLFNAFNSRSETTSAFHHIFVNHWLWAAVTFGLFAQISVVELPLLQAAFGTASLDPSQWLVCVALASTVLWVDELRKLIHRGFSNR